MPIYEYVCDDCGHELEALQGLNDEMLVECPACAHPALRRKISAAAFRLKGSGWYETDFKKDNRRNLAGDQPSSNQSQGKSAEGGKKEAAQAGANQSKGTTAASPKDSGSK
ncbi:FmdB family zinc ribbon protein [Spiribacter roseus]|uniref:FmdB family zinc ribbon protein n=1 Tax=Spiribacter roseus TaxID=1855875 RepID=UPI0013302174|nr:zinc ribbon domain-containing protein [Spiribacter roseus]KAF0283191.1 FmdB family transcriptional regulator [Spiribacter roseus]